jgi:hypothetical protein
MKAEELEGVVPDVGMGVEHDLPRHLGQLVKGGQGDEEKVADPVHIDHDPVRLLADKATANLGDHLTTSEAAPAVARLAGGRGHGQGVGGVRRLRFRPMEEQSTMAHLPFCAWP